MIIIVNIAYLIVLVGFFLASVFVVFHLLSYSYNKAMAIATTILFVSVASVLFLSDIALFYSLNFERILSPIL